MSQSREVRFANWMSRVDMYLEEMTGVTSLDLPDMDYFDMFDWGVLPKTAANIVVVESKNY